MADVLGALAGALTEYIGPASLDARLVSCALTDDDHTLGQVVSLMLVESTQRGVRPGHADALGVLSDMRLLAE
jgi:hypothetical protein